MGSVKQVCSLCTLSQHYTRQATVGGTIWYLIDHLQTTEIYRFNKKSFPQRALFEHLIETIGTKKAIYIDRDALCAVCIYNNTVFM